MTQLDADTGIMGDAAAESTTEPTANWRDNLSDTYKDSESLASFGTLDDLAKGFIETKAMVGANTVKIPGNGATEEQLSEFYNAVGRPEAADKYTMPTENMPENFQPDASRLESFQKEAHRLGLTDAQFAGLVRADANMMHDLNQSASEQSQAQIDEQIAGLQKEYGQAFGEKVGFVKNLLSQFGEQGLGDTIAGTGLDRNPEFFRFMVKVAEKFTDDEVIGSGGNRSFTLSPADARAQISALHLDPEYMSVYMGNQTDPRHRDAVTKMERLYQIANS